MLENKDDDSTYYSSIIKETKKISSIDLSNDVSFDIDSETYKLYDFLSQKEFNYNKHINILKSGSVKVKNNEVVNNIFKDIYDEYYSIFGGVEIFNAIIVYFGFNEKYFFDRLMIEYRTILIKDLSKAMNLKIK